MKHASLPTGFYENYSPELSTRMSSRTHKGWKQKSLPLSLKHTAVVVMHAWDCGTPEQYPGWYRVAGEWIQKATRIQKKVFPELLSAVRASPLPLFHVVGCGKYYDSFPGYRQAKRWVKKMKLVEPIDTRKPQFAKADPIYDKLRAFKKIHLSGKQNVNDIARGFESLKFAPEALPQGDEGIAENTSQLVALCRHHRINHLIYVGFNLEACLLCSAGGMLDMSRRGFLCSTIPEAVTAVESKETTTGDYVKKHGLWRVAYSFGFVYNLKDFLKFCSGK
jgi:hypothetical protein